MAATSSAPTILRVLMLLAQRTVLRYMPRYREYQENERNFLF